MSGNRSTFAIVVLALAIPAGVSGQERNDAWRGRAFVNFNVGVQTASPNFGYDHSTGLFEETARAGFDTPGKTGATFDIGGGVRLVQNLGVGVTYSRYSNERTATLSTTIPSPFDWNAASTAEQLLPMQRKEDAMHLQAIYRIPVSNKFQVGVFGGPSYFRCLDDEVTQFALMSTVDVQDFDWNVYFKDVTQSVNKESVWGYHAGADVTYLVAKHFGVGATVRYSDAAHNALNHFADTTNLYEEGVWGGDNTAVTVNMKHGGLHVNGGVSFRF